MTTKKVLKKFIKNGVEYHLPEGGSGGGGDIDIPSVNALIDCKLGNFDNLFRLDSGLYKVLNGLDEEDNLGLTSGETRTDIVGNTANLSKVSHSYSAMVYVSNSSYAVGVVLNTATATNEISECWNSITIIAENDIAGTLYLNSANGQSALSSYTTAKEAFGYSSTDEVFAIALKNSSFLTWLDSNTSAKARINNLSPNDLMPAIDYYTGLSYSDFDTLCQDNTAFNTLSENTNAMKIVNANDEAKAIYDMYDIYNIESVATNPAKLNNALKNSDWIAYFTSSDHNAELQAQKTNLYNTVVNNSSYFTQYTRTSADGVSSLNNNTKVSNAIVFFAGGYWSSTSQYSNMFHSNGVQAVSANTYYRPSSVSATQLSGVSFSNATFTETGDGYAAIAVYTAV